MTTLLLDTHVVLWAALAPERLGVKAKGLIDANACLVSTGVGRTYSGKPNTTVVVL